MFQSFSFQGLIDVTKSLKLYNETSDQATDMDENEDFDVTIINNPTCSEHKMKNKET